MPKEKGVNNKEFVALSKENRERTKCESDANLAISFEIALNAFKTGVDSNIIVGSGVTMIGDGVLMVGEGNVLSKDTLTFHIVKGKKSSVIKDRSNVYQCKSDVNGGVFEINGSKITIEKNGEWDIDLNDNAIIDLNDYPIMRIGVDKFKFSKHGTPLATQIRNLSKSGDGIMFQFFF